MLRCAEVRTLLGLHYLHILSVASAWKLSVTQTPSEDPEEGIEDKRSEVFIYSEDILLVSCPLESFSPVGSPSGEAEAGGN